MAHSDSVVISVFIPFTRLRYVDEFLKMFEQIMLAPETTELVFYNDTDDAELQQTLSSWLASPYASKFAARTLYQSGNSTPSDVNIGYRRRRIVDMKNRSKSLIGNSKYVFCLEDDTFVEPDAFAKLYALIEQDPNCRIVSGVERGRWGFGIIGAWAMDDVHDPQEVRTLPYKPDGLQYVDGVGWYCYLTPTALYKAAEYRFEAECLGPDVCYTMDLRRQGYSALVDWSLVCKHRHNNQFLLPDADCGVAAWRKEQDQWNLIQDPSAPQGNG